MNRAKHEQGERARRASGAATFLLALVLSPITAAQDRATAVAPRINASGGRLIDEEACYDVQHYDLTLRVDPEAKTIAGTLTMRAAAVADCPRIALDLDDALRAEAIAVDGAAAKFAQRDGRLWIEPPTAPATGAEFEVAVTYGGAPRVAPHPPWEGGFTWAKTQAGQPWIATSCQGEGADLWWPCKDHPSDKPQGVDLHITVPAGLIVASNGTLQGESDAAGGGRTFHWHVASPISNYCVALNIAPYEVISDTYTCVDGTETPVRFFALPEHAERAKRILPQFLDHLRAFEEILGPYPFRGEKYGVAETPHLGMEHQTIIAYGNHYTDMSYDWLHNHELSHEWWGNLVTCNDWRDMWIHEGFGTYMQALYLEKRRGRSAYDAEMRRQAHFVNRIAVAPRQSMDSRQIYFDNGGSNDIYAKGAWVLHTLRWLLGDERFFACLRKFCYPTEAAAKATDGSQVRLVCTDDFVKTCNEVAGEDLAWFFEVYVRQPRLPGLREEVRDGALHLDWEVPQGLSFSLPVPVVVGDQPRRVEMPGGHGQVELGGADYEVDPEARVLMQRR